jgi:hypothetical protein
MMRTATSQQGGTVVEYATAEVEPYNLGIEFERTLKIANIKYNMTQFSHFHLASAGLNKTA